VDTTYPFEETVLIRVGIASGRTAVGGLRLRIPGWATASELTVAGETVPLDALIDGHVTIDRDWADGDEVVLTMPMTPRVDRREGQSAVVRLGPLTMALRIPENWITVTGAPGIGEWEVHPRTSWNFGLADVDGVSDWTVSRRHPGPVPFSLDSAPVTIATRGAHAMTWGLDGAQAAAVPSGPVHDIGPLVDITLIPYGCARLRVTEFPVIAPGHVDHFDEGPPSAGR
jgi:hypothetical protein